LEYQRRGTSKTPTAAKHGNLPCPVGRPPTNNFALCRPKDYFDLFLTPDFVNDNILKTMNARATAEGAGSVTYQDFVPFSVQEFYKFIGLLFANSVSPKPQVINWFLSTKPKIFGNDASTKYFDKVTLSGKVISGLRRWKQLRRFLACYDFRKDPTVTEGGSSLEGGIHPGAPKKELSALLGARKVCLD
jgi:hypothetical protein